jgi:hypothetical protein
MILDYRVPITKDNYRNIIDNNDNKKRAWSRSKPSNLSKLSKVELLFEYGYIPDYDDILYACQKKVLIDRLERFGIVPDQNMFRVCVESQFIPNYDFQEVDQDELMDAKTRVNLIDYLNSYDSNSVKEVKKIIGVRKLTIDDDIMNAACRHLGRRLIITYLMSLGGEISERCFSHLIGNLNKEESLIATEFMKYHSKKIQELENRIAELEK